MYAYVSVHVYVYTGVSYMGVYNYMYYIASYVCVYNYANTVDFKHFK